MSRIKRDFSEKMHSRHHFFEVLASRSAGLMANGKDGTDQKIKSDPHPLLIPQIPSFQYSTNPLGLKHTPLSEL